MMIGICRLQLEPFLGALVPIFGQNLGLTIEWLLYRNSDFIIVFLVEFS